MQKAYYAVFIPDEGKVSVLFPDVPGCATWGETPEHAFGQAIEALEGHLEALADDGDPIPAPSTREDAWEKAKEQLAGLGMGELPAGTLLQLVPAPELDNTNVRINVSIKRYLLERIDRKADAAGMTRSGFLAAAASAFEAHHHG